MVEQDAGGIDGHMWWESSSDTNQWTQMYLFIVQQWMHKAENIIYTSNILWLTMFSVKKKKKSDLLQFRLSKFSSSINPMTFVLSHKVLQQIFN